MTFCLEYLSFVSCCKQIIIPGHWHCLFDRTLGYPGEGPNENVNEDIFKNSRGRPPKRKRKKMNWKYGECKRNTRRGRKKI